MWMRAARTRIAKLTMPQWSCMALRMHGSDVVERGKLGEFSLNDVLSF